MNDSTSYFYQTLDNGLRIVCEHRPTAAAEYFGIAVMVGSRDEAPDEHGIAHFVEHTIFKGTIKRKSWHILNRMESVGGELNAYTTKEETYIYSAFPCGNLTRAAELIYDLAANSQFPKHQIDLEREVVADEIASYLDSPADAIYDDFEDILFAGCGLGHNILGNETSLQSFTPEKCRNFLERFYVAPNMVAFYSGAHPTDKAAKIIGNIFSKLKGDPPLRKDKELNILNKNFSKTINLSLHQSHTIVGAVTHGIYSNDVATGALFTNIVGGPGMNSLLNLSLRERSGMVYTVEASTALYRDHGMWSVYFGCDSKDTERCISKIKQTIEFLAKTPLKANTLHKYKKQLSGQMTMARDHREGSITAIARSTLYHGHALTPEENIARISAVTTEDIQKYALNLLELSQLSFE